MIILEPSIFNIEQIIIYNRTMTIKRLVLRRLVITITITITIIEAAN